MTTLSHPHPNLRNPRGVSFSTYGIDTAVWARQLEFMYESHGLSIKMIISGLIIIKYEKAYFVIYTLTAKTIFDYHYSQ